MVAKARLVLVVVLDVSHGECVGRGRGGCEVREWDESRMSECVRKWKK